MGKKKSKSKTVSTPWGPAQGAITSSLGTVQNVVNSNQPKLESMANDIRGYLPGLAEKAFGNDAGLDVARGYATDVLGGKYLGAGNPYLNQMTGIARGNVADDVNSRFGASGRSLGGAHAGVLGSKMMEAELGLRYNDYNQERGRMGEAAGMMPSLTAAEVSRIAPYLAATEMAGSLPYAGIGALNSTIGLAQGSGTTKTKQPGGWGPALLGGLAGSLKSFATGGMG